jgi:hypothetical protein
MKLVFLGFKIDTDSIPDDYVKKIIYTAITEGAALGFQLEEIHYSTGEVPREDS